MERRCRSFQAGNNHDNDDDNDDDDDDKEGKTTTTTSTAEMTTTTTVTITATTKTEEKKRAYERWSPREGGCWINTIRQYTRPSQSKQTARKNNSNALVHHQLQELPAVV